MGWEIFLQSWHLKLPDLDLRVGTLRIWLISAMSFFFNHLDIYLNFFSRDRWDAFLSE